MKQRWTALLMLFVVILSCAFGCAPQEQAEPEADALLELERDAPVYSSETVVLYFPSANEPEQLYAESRRVNVSSVSSLVDVAMEALLDGPQDDDLYAIIPDGVRLVMTEQSSNLVTVHLSSELLTLNDRQLLLAKISIINTLTSIPGVEYVTLMCDEKEVTVMGYASGAEGMFIGTLDEKIAQIEDALRNGVNERKITLYFQDSTNSYLLPEVRTVSNTDDMAQTVMMELLKGPVDTVRCEPVSQRELTLLETPKMSTRSDGSTLLTVNLSDDEDFWSGTYGRRMLRVGAIVLSLTSNLPQVDYVSVQMDSVTINRYVGGQGNYLQASMFRDLVGETMQLYFPSLTGEALVEVQRIVDQSSVGRARDVLLQLLAGPAQSEKQDAAPLPVSWTEDDIVSLRIQNGLLTINMRSAAIEELFALEQDEQYTCVYAIVNSLCGLQGITRVRFLADGQSIASGGAVSLENPLMPNVGLVY